MTYSSVISALADPTRRRLLERLRRQDQSVGDLAKYAHVTQPAVSQHLRVLREAELVSSRSEGTRRYYSINRVGLVALRRYLESYWDDVLAAYAAGDPAPPKKGT